MAGQGRRGCRSLRTPGHAHWQTPQPAPAAVAAGHLTVPASTCPAASGAMCETRSAGPADSRSSSGRAAPGAAALNSVTPSACCGSDACGSGRGLCGVGPLVNYSQRVRERLHTALRSVRAVTEAQRQPVRQRFVAGQSGILRNMPFFHTPPPPWRPRRASREVMSLHPLPCALPHPGLAGGAGPGRVRTGPQLPRQ